MDPHHPPGTPSRPDEEDRDDYRIREPLEIRALLGDMFASKALISLDAPDGLRHTTLIDALVPSQSRIVLAADDAHHLPAMIESGEVTATCYLDRIKVQFELHGTVLVRGHRALISAEWPRQLWRFQRRQNFRVVPPHSLSPHVRLVHPHTDTPLLLRVLDISESGLALALPLETPLLDAGISLRHCQLELGQGEVVSVTLSVQHVSVLNPSTQAARVGCEFHDLSAPDARLLRAWIDQTQKRLAAMHRR